MGLHFNFYSFYVLFCIILSFASITCLCALQGITFIIFMELYFYHLVQAWSLQSCVFVLFSGVVK